MTGSLRCDGKLRFDSRKRAEQRARIMRRDRERSVEVYSCRECGGWHIGGNEFSKHTVRPVRRCVQIMVGGLE
ncbi:hypothetical protein [Acetobacter cerevisiae]|uniref:hypothetical protein n=1 Tax=Acetobacter cerevisiae TaxID=178900 RepID=UPI0020A37E05|nr:hypothetical protein [Acetobacter cerevisiae]MCP1278504.1 hypothetical protein [Acetobacter cerevisiae]